MNIQSNANKTIKNIIYSVISQIIVIVLGLIVPRIILVHYGSETNGLLNSVNQIVAYLVVFEAGIQAVALQALYKPVREGDKSSVNSILSAVNINYKKTGTLYFIGLLMLSIGYPILIKTELSYLSVFCVVFFSGFGNVILFFVQGKYKILLQAEGKTYILTNVQTLITVCNNILKVILLSLNYNVAVVIFSTFIISLFQAIYIIIYIKKYYKWIDLAEQPNLQALSQRGFALVHQISGLICQNTDVLVLTFFCNLKVVSVYSMYKLIITHVSSLLNIPFNSASFALGQVFNTNKKKYSEIIDAVEVCYSTFVFSIYAVVICLLAPFISLYTRGITDIAYVDYKLVLLFVFIELITFMRTPMINTINFAGHFKNTLHQTIIESIINLTVSLVAVMRFEIYGVLFGTIAAFLYRTTIIIYYANKKILNRGCIKTFLIYAVNFISMFIVVSLYNTLKIEILSYGSFVIVGSICSIVFVIVFFGIAFIVWNKDIKCFYSIIVKELMYRFKK